MEKEDNVNPINNLVIHGDATTDTTKNPLDTKVNPGDTTTDTTKNPLFSTGDITENPLDTKVNPSDTTGDSEMNPLFSTGDTTKNPLDTKVNPSETTLRTAHSTSEKILGIPDDRFNRPSKGSRNNQVGSVRLNDKEFENFSKIALNLELSNYNLLHRVIRSFIENPYGNEGFKADTIRKEEKAWYDERIKGLMPITTHEKQLREETEILLEQLAETNNRLKEATENLAQIQKSDMYLFLSSNLQMVKEIMKFMTILKNNNPVITPTEFINSYLRIQQRLKSLQSKDDEELTAKLKQQKEELIGMFVKVIQELCDSHVLHPFCPWEFLYHNALARLNIK